METFKTKYVADKPPQTFLLPLSFGPCSLSLLDVLDGHLRGQSKKSGRTGYRLHVLHVERPALLEPTASVHTKLDEVQQRFPQHEYSSIPLSVGTDSADLDVLIQDGKPDRDSSDVSTDDERLQRLLSSATSPTAKTDILQTLLTKTIVSFAQSHDCDTVLWADSTTRLAEKTLAETAKGRGQNLPWVVADGHTPQSHGLRFQYPVRDLLKKELVAYTESGEPPLASLLVRPDVKPAVSAKNNTIDELVTQYFESVEENYPGIVANVVKTTGKLQMPSTDDSETFCSFCGFPSTSVNAEMDSGSNVALSGSPSDLCSSCSRNMKLQT